LFGNGAELIFQAQEEHVRLAGLDASPLTDPRAFFWHAHGKRLHGVGVLWRVAFVLLAPGVAQVGRDIDEIGIP
jgi:hypothetical protein